MSFEEETMNLIEQLGGYEEAKEWHKDQDLRGNHTVRIRQALLEYRRANNIFAVGDAMDIPSRGNGIFHFNALFSDQDIAEARHATPQEIEAGHRL